MSEPGQIIFAVDPATDGGGVAFVKHGRAYATLEPRRCLDPAALLAAITAHGGSETGGNLHGDEGGN